MSKYADIFKENLRESKGLQSFVRESYSRWQKKYLKGKDALDEKFQNKFIPGKIYSFDYRASKLEDFADEKILAVLDHRPILLSMGAVVVGSQIMESGINFNAVPYPFRPMIMDRLDKYYGRVIRQNESKIEDGRPGTQAIPMTYDQAVKLLAGTGWSMAYMVFDRQFIKAIDTVDYDDWGMVMGLNTRAIQGVQPEKMYAEYLKKLTRNPKL
jgi:hypothetical protein